MASYFNLVFLITIYFKHCGRKRKLAILPKIKFQWKLAQLTYTDSKGSWQSSRPLKGGIPRNATFKADVHFQIFMRKDLAGKISSILYKCANVMKGPFFPKGRTHV